MNHLTSKDFIKIGERLWHVNLGRVRWTDQCRAMDLQHPSEEWIHVEHEGELKRVSRNLVYRAGGRY